MLQYKLRLRSELFKQIGLTNLWKTQQILYRCLPVSEK